MKRLITVISLCTLICGASVAAEIRGSWTAERNDASTLQINLASRGNNHGQSMSISDFTGLSDAAIRATQQTPVTFSLNREAGTVNFEGTFKDGFGAGQFRFNANPSYLAALRNMGVHFEDSDHDDREFMTMALLDVSSAFIRSMQAEGYRESGEKYLAMRIFRVTPELVRELRSLGYDKIETDDLIATRIHKVTPEYIRAMRAAGYSNVSLDDLVATRIHKATPEFLADMKVLGYGNLEIDDAVAFRIHGVTPEFVRALRDLGYTGVPADDLVAMRIHRVTPEFIRQLKDAGYEHIPVEKLVEMRIQGIDADFVKKMNH